MEMKTRYKTGLKTGKVVKIGYKTRETRRTRGGKRTRGTRGTRLKSGFRKERTSKAS